MKGRVLAWAGYSIRHQVTMAEHVYLEISITSHTERVIRNDAGWRITGVLKYSSLEDTLEEIEKRWWSWEQH